MPSGPKKKVSTSERRTLLVGAMMTVGGGYWLMGSPLLCLTAVRSDSTLLLIRNNGDHETIVALAADSLDRRCVEARIRSNDFIHAAHSLDGRVGIGRVNHLSVPHDVVADDQAPAPGESEGPLQITRIVAFVCIDENKVEGSIAFG